MPKAGKYAFKARVVTANYDQRLNVKVNDNADELVMGMPFTEGDWKESDPIMLMLKEGENTLQFSRNQPPQYGIAVKDFTLTPAK